eukprot:2550205-Lingulodinium_polyedra.AAC.1
MLVCIHDALEELERQAGRIARRAIATDSLEGAAQRPSAISAVLHAIGARNNGPGSPAEWQSAEPLANQDHAHML